MTTAHFQSCGAGWQIQFIVNNQNISWRYAQKFRQSTHRLTTAIHEGGWFLQTAVITVQGATPDLGMETRLGSQRAMTGTREFVDEPEPGIVPGLVVFGTGITQSNDELYLRQTGSTPPSKQP
jgi:hypothetical protein